MNNYYNYYVALYNDIMQYVRENVDLIDYIDQDKRELDRDALEERLNDDCWIADNVTGNASGSYYCNAYKAHEAVHGNEHILIEALEEFGNEAESYKRALTSPEYADCTIRCYLLGSEVNHVINDIEDYINEYTRNINQISSETLYNDIIKGA